jgi:hypothetical protein
MPGHKSSDLYYQVLAANVISLIKQLTVQLYLSDYLSDMPSISLQVFGQSHAVFQPRDLQVRGESLRQIVQMETACRVQLLGSGIALHDILNNKRPCITSWS